MSGFYLYPREHSTFLNTICWPCGQQLELRSVIYTRSNKTKPPVPLLVSLTHYHGRSPLIPRSAEMNTARRPSNSAPQVIDRYPPRSRANTSEAPRSHPQPLDPNPQTVPTPDLFMNQSQRPGLSRTHASYSSPPTQPFPAQLYPAHLQNLAPNSYPGPPSSPGFNHWQGQSPVQVNRVATLPNPLPQHFHHGRPPQHPHLASPSSPAPAYSDPEFIPPIPHQTIPRQLTPPNIQHAGLPEQPIPQSQSHPRTSPPPPPITEDLPPPRSPPRTPASPTDEAELALAIELSQKMVMEQKEREEKLRRQEEEELERALAQSMLETTSYGSIHPDFLLDDQIASSSKTKLDSPPPVESKTPSRDDSQLTQSPTAEPSVLPQPAELGRYDKSRIPGYDAASMALSEVAAGKQPVSGDNFSTLPPPPEVDGDPVRVAQDGDTVLSNFPPYDSSRSTSPLHIPKPLDNESSNSTSNPTSTESLYEPTSTLDSLESPSELAYYDDVPSTPVPLDRPPSSINPTSEETPSLFTGNRGIANRGISPPPRPASIHVPQASSVVMLGSPGPSPPSSYNPQRQDISSSLGLERVSSNGSLGSTSQNTAALGRPAPPASVATSVPQLGNVNHYIDPDLLLGVCEHCSDSRCYSHLLTIASFQPLISVLRFCKHN